MSEVPLYRETNVRLSPNETTTVLRAPTAWSTEGPLWGHPRPVLGATDPYLEPFCGHLSPKVDKIFQK